jgi:hypothetical protein
VRNDSRRLRPTTRQALAHEFITSVVYTTHDVDYVLLCSDHEDGVARRIVSVVCELARLTGEVFNGRRTAADDIACWNTLAMITSPSAGPAAITGEEFRSVFVVYVDTPMQIRRGNTSLWSSTEVPVVSITATLAKRAVQTSYSFVS